MADINISGLGDAGKGMNEGSKGFVRIFSGIPHRSEINAEIKATKDIMDAISSIRNDGVARGLPDEIIDGLCRDTIDRIGRIRNYEKVLSFAAPRVETDAHPEDLVGSTWMNYFRDHSEKITEADVQAMWGAILAGEINQPGAVSKRAMSILADMDKADVEALRTLCSCCIGGRMENGTEQEIRPILVGMDEQYAMEASDIDRLRSLGLIDFDTRIAAFQNQLFDCTNGLLFQVGTTAYCITGKQGNMYPLPVRPFTKHGLELARLCTLGNAVGFTDALIGHWVSMGFEVGVVEEWVGSSARCRVIRSLR